LEGSETWWKFGGGGTGWTKEVIGRGKGKVSKKAWEGHKSWDLQVQVGNSFTGEICGAKTLNFGEPFGEKRRGLCYPGGGIAGVENPCVKTGNLCVQR